MDRVMLERSLIRAEGYVTRGERCVVRQHQIVAALAQGRHDTASAMQLLAIFQKTLKTLCLHRDRLFNEWAQSCQR